MFFVSFLLFTAILGAEEIEGVVRTVYPQSGKVYFSLDESALLPAERCHGTSNSYYYYFEADKKADPSDPLYHEKRFQSFNSFSLLMLSAASKGTANQIKVKISIPDRSKCANGATPATFKIDNLKVY